MTRPQYSQHSFLQHLFSPKRHVQPSGIRKTTLSGLRGGRKAGRLAAFNRMKPVSQQLLKESGKREAYLRGEISLSSARKVLREEAVALGLVRPLPVRQAAAPVTGSRKQQIEARMAYHVKSVLQRAGKKFNPATIDKNMRLIPDYAAPAVLQMDYDDLRVAASPGSPFEYQRIEDSTRYNPLWYR